MSGLLSKGTLVIHAITIAMLLVLAGLGVADDRRLADGDPLKERWYDLWNRLEERGAAGDHERVYHLLVTRYSEVHRAYHNLAHVKHALEEFDQVRRLAKDEVAVEFALWCHDAVYDIGSRTNEEESARFAGEAALEFGLSEEWAEDVAGLILATRHDALSDDADAQLVVDIDLSILGQSWDRFDVYEEEIRSEYAPVIEQRGVAGFNAGRAAILKRFLARPAIYATDYFHRKYDTQARENLRRSIERLEATP
jgi:predicted metal-dependent HD superfamily phosphohydrolase